MLNPLQHTEANIMDDTDLAGPLVFCLAFGGCLLLVRDKNSRKAVADNGILLSGRSLATADPQLSRPSIKRTLSLVPKVTSFISLVMNPYSADSFISSSSSIKLARTLKYIVLG